MTLNIIYVSPSGYCVPETHQYHVRQREKGDQGGDDHFAHVALVQRQCHNDQEWWCQCNVDL